jgi:DNA-binding MarR family transcriptional regulator
MEALQLFLLGRRLTKLGGAAIRGDRSTDIPASVLLLLQHIFVHPDSSITEIAAGTGLPQSFVSTSVAQLRAMGLAETSTDPSDARRTLVRSAPAFARHLAERGTAPVDGVIADALGSADPQEVSEVIAQLEDLYRRLVPPAAQARMGTGTRSTTAGAMQERQRTERHRAGR